MFSNETDILEFDSHLKDINSLIQATLGRKNPLKKNSETHSDKSQEDQENNIITDNEDTNQNQIKSINQLKAELSLSVKVLGNELDTYNINDFYPELHQDKDVRKTIKSGEFGYQHPIINAMEFYTFPTSVGFPIEINANVSLLLILKSIVTSDNREWPLSKFDLALNMTTGFTLNLSGSMVVDAHNFKNGLHLSIDSAIQKNMRCSLSLVGDKRADYKIEMPENQNSHFNLNSSVEVIF